MIGVADVGNMVEKENWSRIILKMCEGTVAS
jgi:hypothetical protein